MAPAGTRPRPPGASTGGDDGIASRGPRAAVPARSSWWRPGRRSSWSPRGRRSWWSPRGRASSWWRPDRPWSWWQPDRSGGVVVVVAAGSSVVVGAEGSTVVVVGSRRRGGRRRARPWRRGWAVRRSGSGCTAAAGAGVDAGVARRRGRRRAVDWRLGPGRRRSPGDDREQRRRPRRWRSRASRRALGDRLSRRAGRSDTASMPVATGARPRDCNESVDVVAPGTK